MLSLKDITAYYGHIKALDEISMEITKGQVTALLGANGAGKTTILKVISGLLKPTSGEMNFENKDISNLNPEQMVAGGVVQVPEGRRIFPRMTVTENLTIGAYSLSNKQNLTDKYHKVYHYFPVLRERSEQLAGTLSGGEQQMLALGRALMSEPKVLMLDEPSLGLAPKIVETIFNIIEEINREGVTVLLVEQNAFKALQIADYGYILETGNMRLEGTGEDLWRNPQVKEAYLGT